MQLTAYLVHNIGPTGKVSTWIGVAIPDGAEIQIRARGTHGRAIRRLRQHIKFIYDEDNIYIKKPRRWGKPRHHAYVYSIDD